MTKETVANQRKEIISTLKNLVEISKPLEEILVNERHSNGLVHRALDPKGKKGFLIHYKSGGFDARYVDEKGQKYELKVYPKWE